MKIAPIIQKTLDDLSVPYEIKQGSRHHKVYVNGRFCAILPHGKPKESCRRAELNLRSQIRKAAIA